MAFCSRQVQVVGALRFRQQKLDSCTRNLVIPKSGHHCHLRCDSQSIFMERQLPKSHIFHNQPWHLLCLTYVFWAALTRGNAFKPLKR